MRKERNKQWEYKMEKADRHLDNVGQGDRHLDKWPRLKSQVVNCVVLRMTLHLLWEPSQKCSTLVYVSNTRQSQIEEYSTKYLASTPKNCHPKVITIKKILSICYRPEAPKQMWWFNVMWYVRHVPKAEKKYWKQNKLLSLVHNMFQS